MTAFVNSGVVVLAIGILIFVHELGHFLVAKKVGIRVEAFSMGFGPALWSIKRGVTTYKICAIPLGGYVKMAGELPDEVSDAPAGDEFFAKSISQRAWVVSAGVIMNIIFAFLLFPIAFGFGVPFTTPVVGEVFPGRPAWEAGIRPNDRIVAIDGREVLGFDDVTSEIASSTGPLDVEIERSGRRLVRRVEPRFNEELGFSEINLTPGRVDYRVLPDSSFARAGIGPEDEILSIDGLPIGRSVLIQEFLELTLDDTPIAVRVRRKASGDIETVSVPRVVKDLEGDASTWIGVKPVSRRLARIIDLGEGISPLIAAGAAIGDRIVAVQGAPVHQDAEIVAALFAAGTQGPIRLSLRRTGPAGEDVAADIELNVDADGLAAIADSTRFETSYEAVSVIKGQPAHRAGLLSGDRIVRIDDVDVAPDEAGWQAFVQRARHAEGKPFPVVVERNGQRLAPITVQPGPRQANYTDGWSSAIDEVNVRVAFPHSLQVGARQAVNQTKKILFTLRSLFIGKVAAKNMGGIITIAHVSYRYSEQGIGKILFFMGFLSLNLAILNILPIPVLDGGHLVFLLLEKIKGGRLSERAMTWANIAGLAMILGMMLFVTYNDILRLID